MSNEQKPQPTAPSGPPMRLERIQFMPDVSVPSGLRGGPSSISYWEHDKHGDIKPVEQKNGDIWLYHPNGRVSKLSPWMIAYTTMGPAK